MEPKRDLAIVLRAIPYEDRHRIVTALTENHGQITALARNCIQSRRFGGALDAFTASEWLFTRRPGAELCSLSEAHVRRGYEGLRKDFEKLSLAAVLNELMMKVAPQDEPCPDLFRLHSNALAELEESAKPGTDQLPLLNAYLAKLLHWNGHRPRLEACLSCQRPLDETVNGESLTCLVTDGGWICSTCRVGQTRHIQEQAPLVRASEGGGGFQHVFLRATPLAILDFQLSLVLPVRKAAAAAQATRRDHQELFRYLEALFAYHVPGFDRQPLRGLRFLDLESSLQSAPVCPRQTPLPPA